MSYSTMTLSQPVAQNIAFALRIEAVDKYTIKFNANGYFDEEAVELVFALEGLDFKTEKAKDAKSKFRAKKEEQSLDLETLYEQCPKFGLNHQAVRNWCGGAWMAFESFHGSYVEERRESMSGYNGWYLDGFDFAIQMLSDETPQGDKHAKDADFQYRLKHMWD